MGILIKSERDTILDFKPALDGFFCLGCQQFL